jgi:Actin like proteins N terminal domain
MVAMFGSANNRQSESQKVAGQVLVSGKDLGAGFGKGIYGEKSIVIPSAYLRVADRNSKQHETISKDGCWVRYVEGDRKDLADTQWFWGTAAINKDPKNYVKLHEDTKSKALYALESILTDLAVLDVASDTEVILSVSSHNPQKWSDDLRRNIAGTHTVEHLRNDASRTKVQKTFTITLVDVFPEGYGSIAYCLFGGDSTASLELAESEVAVGLDFGTSTLIVTVFDGTGSVIDRNLIEGGSGELYQAIADTLDKSKSGSNRMMRDTQHDTSLIRKGVESFADKGKFIHGNSALVGKPFDAEYWECFKSWFDSRLQKVFNFVGNNGYNDRAQYLVTWGGAAQLPGMSDALAEFGVVFLPTPQMINAKGLQLLTQVSIGE